MKSLIRNIIEKAIKSAGYAVPADFSVETPPQSEMGDFATNAAMIIAGKDKEDPRKIAEKIKNHLSVAKDIAKVSIAGPGFINISLAKKLYIKKLSDILVQGSDFGRGSAKKTKVLVEYISANPTGPLHVGNARGGPIGEAFAGLYSFLGYKVEREFYVNDMGLQIERFGRSLYYWYAKKTNHRTEFPTDGYPAPYIKEISEKIQKDNKEKLTELKNEAELIDFFVKEGLYHTIKSIRNDCELIGIKFDNFSHESDLQYSGKAEAAVNKLKSGGFTVNREGALWFKNPEDPEFTDQESVLVKSDGKSITYFTDDIAYHIDKFARGYDKTINILGANHHGHIPRFRAAMRAVGVSDNKIEILLYQYIRLKKSGKTVSMGKRLGNFVTLRQVIESGVSPDAFKYFNLSQNPNTPFDFDLELAKDTTEKNPVYYIKYAHARICSILKKAGLSTRPKGSPSGIGAGPSTLLRAGEKGSDSAKVDLALLKEEAELNLVKELVKFPEILEQIKGDFQIQSLPHYAYKIATLLHAFYDQCRVISKDKKLTRARLSLILAVKYVLANALEICGIDAPEHMEKTKPKTKH